ANLTKALGAVELHHSDRILVATLLADELAVQLHIWLAATGADARLGLHAAHKLLEIARRQFQVEIELADVFELLGIDRGKSLVERLDHAAAQLAIAAIGSRNDVNERK